MKKIILIKNFFANIHWHLSIGIKTKSMLVNTIIYSHGKDTYAAARADDVDHWYRSAISQCNAKKSRRCISINEAIGQYADTCSSRLVRTRMQLYRRCSCSYVYILKFHESELASTRSCRQRCARASFPPTSRLRRPRWDGVRERAPVYEAYSRDLPFHDVVPSVSVSPTLSLSPLFLSASLHAKVHIRAWVACTGQSCAARNPVYAICTCCTYARTQERADD